MGYNFTIKDGFRIKQEGEYPWPWAGEPHRTIHLYLDDVLTKSEDGTYMKHTGLCCLSIRLKEDEVEPWGKDCDLTLL